MDSVRGEEDIYLIRTDTFCSQLWEINGLSKMKLLSLTTLRSKLCSYFASISYTTTHLRSCVVLVCTSFEVRSDVGRVIDSVCVFSRFSCRNSN